MRYFVFFKHYKFSIIVAAVIFYISILKPAQLPSDITLFDGADKLIHLLMYLGLGLVLNFEAYKTACHCGPDPQSPIKQEIAGQARNDRWLWLIVLAFPVLFGGMIEILQANFFPPRTGEWLDFLANTTGVLLAYPIYHKFSLK